MERKWLTRTPTPGTTGMRCLMVAALLATVVLLACMHARAVSPALRYTRVAEGNISLAVGFVLGDGLKAYGHLLHGDAEEWGRIRPVHMPYHSVPFILTLIRNGDLFARCPGVPVRERLNGDLQTHVIFLMVSYGLATIAMGWALWRLGGNWWSAVLFVICAWSSLTLCENLLVYYCDSGEIGQLTWITLYLVSISGAFAGRTPSRRAEAAGYVFAILAYGMKETTIILGPALFLSLGLLVWRKWREDRAYGRFCLRQAVLHVGLTAVLLSFVHAYRHGAYVASNYASLTPRLWTVDAALLAMTVGLPIFRLLAVTAGAWGALVLVRGRGGNGDAASDEPVLRFAVLSTGLAAAFWTVNLPWQQPLIKYQLPAYFFACLGTMAVTALAAGRLHRSGARLAGAIWAVGLACFVALGARAFADEAATYYRRWYAERWAVPGVAADVAAEAKADPSRPRVVRVVAGTLFQEGVLPFARQVNLLHGVNIVRAGKPTHHIEAFERNYFRVTPSAAAVDLTLSRTLPAEGEAEIVYVYPCEVSKKRLSSWNSGYVKDGLFQDPSGDVVKFRRR